VHLQTPSEWLKGQHNKTQAREKDRNKLEFAMCETSITRALKQDYVKLH